MFLETRGVVLLYLLIFTTLVTVNNAVTALDNFDRQEYDQICYDTKPLPSHENITYQFDLNNSSEEIFSSLIMDASLKVFIGLTVDNNSSTDVNLIVKTYQTNITTVHPGENYQTEIITAEIHVVINSTGTASGIISVHYTVVGLGIGIGLHVYIGILILSMIIINLVYIRRRKLRILIT